MCRDKFNLDLPSSIVVKKKGRSVAHLTIMIYKKFELMLIRRAKAYSSSGSVV